MKAVCTVCGAERDKSEIKIPARKRYSGKHVEKAGEQARKLQLRFFILSGLFGLLEEEAMIPNYHYPLEEKMAPKLAKRVVSQLGEHYITELIVYSTNKEDQAVYVKVLELAAAEAQVKLVRRTLK